MILVVNSGSSSIKFKLFAIKKNVPIAILDGLAERIGVDGFLKIEFNGEKHQFNQKMSNHNEAIQFILKQFEELKVIKDKKDIAAVGFRIVHGGKITEPVVIDKKVFKEIEACVKLAPLHNPGALVAIEAFKIEMPKVKLIASFDTSFHQTMDEETFLYSVPYEWYKKYQVRKFGFHGISYKYITEKYAKMIKKPVGKLNLIICHLGSGASVACVKNGKSIDTTMGFTPLAGLMMGTRSGDIDPSIIQYMVKALNKDVFEITSILNKESGLKGFSEISSDMREIIAEVEKGNKHAVLTLNKYSQNVADFIVKYANRLEGKIDALIFTAGIGENSDTVRKEIINRVNILGLKLNPKENIKRYDDFLKISNKDSKFDIYAIKTNEELMICQETMDLTS
ncbi:acetate kinase [Williamsoniiplasma somnilux]|uniref:Acetate kinase n=1 Tax=Williamsoniiplasma somnilux TaxID=215578 RepID=A0A2K8P0F8_9MOLU|nr:acetate kinase [Williamsoniiplasma somnilux]ATZ18928.1 acetate kinase [Williamsoniiplasma somnilux]